MIFKKNSKEDIDEKDIDTDIEQKSDKNLEILRLILAEVERLLFTAKNTCISKHIAKIEEEIITALDGLYPDWVYPKVEEADKYSDETMIASLHEILTDIQEGRDEATSMAVQCFLASAGIRTVQALRALYAKVDNKS